MDLFTGCGFFGKQSQHWMSERYGRGEGEKCDGEG